MTPASGGVLGVAKHTPGPWFFGQNPHQRANHPSQRTIALSLEPDGSPFGYRLGVDNDDGAYLNLSGFCSEADARLIAAAPVMFAALQDCETYFANLSGMTVDDAQDAMNTVRAALRSAAEAARAGEGK